MFRSLAELFKTTGTPSDAARLFLVHPVQLSRWLEDAWVTAQNVPAIGGSPGGQPQLGSPTVIGDLDLPQDLRSLFPAYVNPQLPQEYQAPMTAGPSALIWEHLIYAYLVESTGVYEIVAEIIRRLAVGETLGQLSPEALQWARTTEDLFFRDAPAFSIGGITSHVRPDARVARRNAYWRMFALDLPHPLSRPRAPWLETGDAPWKADVGNGVNTAFREKWSELLRQLWLGLENARNQVGANATDREYVALLCDAIDDMLGMRRRGGQLAREEFVFVTAMSWFHLTVEYDTPIVVDLKATATSPADRLTKLGERVGMSPAPRSRELLDLAEPMSSLMWGIEFGSFNTGAGAETLYLPPGGIGNPPSQLNQDVNRIIDLWQSATGERVKDRPAGNVVGRPAQPLRIPSPGPAVAAAPSGMLARASNGRTS